MHVMNGPLMACQAHRTVYIAPVSSHVAPPHAHAGTLCDGVRPAQAVCAWGSRLAAFPLHMRARMQPGQLSLQLALYAALRRLHMIENAEQVLPS